MIESKYKEVWTQDTKNYLQKRSISYMKFIWVKLQWLQNDKNTSTEFEW